MTRASRATGRPTWGWAWLGFAISLSGCSVVATTPAPAGPAPTGVEPTEAPVGRAARPPIARRSGVPPRRDFEEVRGLWVVRSTMTSRREVLEMVDAAADAGFNTLLVQVRGRADAFYDSRWEPRAETITDDGSFDPLAVAIDAGHARGLAVHAWVNTHLVWGPAEPPRAPGHMVNARPDWLSVPRALGRELHDVAPDHPSYRERLRAHAEANRGTVEGLYSSPSHPEVQERVYGVWMELAERYDLDGIHFDYVRFPSSDYDYSRGALDRFRAWVSPRLSAAQLSELERGAASDPYAFVDALPEAWGEFRRAQITGLVRRVYTGVKARRPAMVVSAAVFSNQDDALRHRFQAWPAWLEEGILDVAVPMAYTPDDDRYLDLVRDARAAAGSRERVWAGIGAYLDTFEGTLRKVDGARREGLGGVILFSYDWLAHEADSDGPVGYLPQIGRARFGGR